MKKTITLLGIVATLLSLGSCEKYRCIKGDDNITIENRRMETPVDRIFLQSSYDVYITQDTVLKMTVEADDNLMPYIVTDVVDNDLFLTTANDRCLRSRNDIRVSISTPSLSSLRLEGSGDIYINELFASDNIELLNQGSGRLRCENLIANGQNLIADVMGSGDIIIDKISINELDVLVGGSGDFEILSESIGDFGIFRIDGSGDILADLIRLQELEVDISGSGDITCWVERLLYGEITGSGNVFYRSLPLRDIRIDLRGSGDYLPL